jgi:hypothetical protein
MVSVCRQVVWVLTWIVDEIVRIEEEVEVFSGLCQEEALHPVLQSVGPHILHSFYFFRIKI